MPDPTPGQVAYAAYWPGLAQHSPYLVSDPPVAWDALPTGVQAAWEAAAQAGRRCAREGERSMGHFYSDDAIIVDLAAVYVAQMVCRNGQWVIDLLLAVGSEGRALCVTYPTQSECERAFLAMRVRLEEGSTQEAAAAAVQDLVRRELREGFAQARVEKEQRHV